MRTLGRFVEGARKTEDEVETTLTYHRHLEKIQRADLDYVRRKDAQYQASWKRRGGPGAMLTIARPWDRFESMAQRNALPWDIFDVMEREGLAGPDGSMIACVRDLRRYLLLVEAEMTERLLADAEMTERLLADARAPVAAYRETFGDAHAQRAAAEGISREVAKARNFGLMYGATSFQGTPEDGGHHDSLSRYAPYTVTREWLHREGLTGDMDLLWWEVAVGVHRLRERVTAEEALKFVTDNPRHATLMALYAYVSDTGRKDELGMPVYSDAAEGTPVAWWLRPHLAPDRESYRVLPPELNHRELLDIGEASELYSLRDGKYRILPEHESWSIE